MEDEIVVSGREFKRHRRRYRKLVDAGHTLIVTRGRRRYAVTATESVEVDTELLCLAHEVFDPNHELSDREVVRLALQTDISTQQSARERANGARDDG